MDYISSYLNHDSKFVIQCLQLVLEEPFVKNKNRINFWNDCGPHFRNGELGEFILNYLPNKNIITTWNFFAEHHGKSTCDAHFSLISRWIKQIELIEKLKTTEQLIKKLTEKAKQNSEIIMFIKEIKNRNESTKKKLLKLLISNLIIIFHV